MSITNQKTGKWPRIQFEITCHTCDEVIRFSIYYGESNIWNNTDAPKMTAWRKHLADGHQVTVQHIFYP